MPGDRAGAGEARALVELAVPVHLASTLAAHRAGGRDPSMVIGPAALWWATRTGDGPVTLRLAGAGGAGTGGLSAHVHATAWGSGAGLALARLPELLGAADGPPFTSDHPVVGPLARRHRGLRVGRARAVVAALVPTIVEQRVTTVEARRSYHGLVRAFGDPAPGPAGRRGLRLGPDPARLAGLAYHDLHRFGIERRRAETVIRVCRDAPRLDGLAAAGPGADQGPTLARLAAVAGIGPWTLAIVAQRAFGDADAVIVDDYHLPHLVSWSLAGEPRADDGRMLELLEPFRPHRGRVVRLLALGGRWAPRRGPRRRLEDIAGR